MSKSVYISSATNEMKYYREVAIKVIKDLGMRPVYLNDGFEAPTTEISLLELNERKVRDCDVFIGLYGYQGTWQPEQSNPKLISEYEYEWARKYKLDCLIFVPGNQTVEDLVPVVHSAKMQSFWMNLVQNYGVTWLVNLEKFKDDLRRRLNALKERIFLSYSSKDKDFVVWFREQLRVDNYRAWRDGDSILPAEDFPLAIDQALATCDVMVLFISPDALKSEWVIKEFHTFIEHKKIIFPILIRPSEALPDEIKRLQIVDGTQDRDIAYVKIKKAIDRFYSS